jgi:hypothetical protein
MTAERPNGRPQPFGPDELAGVDGVRPDELAAETRIARDLEGVALRGGVATSSDFTDRVMGAVAAEPVPAPVIAAGSALRHGAALGFLASIRDSFRVAFGGGFPVAVRAQALALVLVVTGVVAGTSLATAGAMGLLEDRGAPSPGPTVAAPSPSEPPSASPMPTESPEATSDAQSASPEPSESEGTETVAPDESDDPAASEEPGDNGSGSETESERTPAPSPKASATPRPTVAPTARPTARPTATPTHEPEESRTPRPTDTPHPEDTPSPSPTPGGD